MPAVESESRRAIIDHFAKRAGAYARLSTWVDDPDSMVPIQQEILLRRPRIAVELGSGSGAVPRFLTARGCQPDLYLGLDLSLAMLRQQGHSAVAVAASADRLPFADGAVDLIVCRQAFHYFGHPAAVLDESYRVLRPGGGLIVAQIVPFDDVEDAAWWRAAVRLRQPLRRHAWTSTTLTAAVAAASFHLDAVSFVERRSSLASWLARYSIGQAERQTLLDHFRHPPTSVDERRRFIVSSDDVQYTIRWMVLSASPRAIGEDAS